jgi:type II secretory pathway pseudopilin PulG
LELVLVVVIIGIVLSLAMPRLLPAIYSSNLEGSARHLANFGRAAITRAAFGHDRFTFNCDLSTGQYWLVRWIDNEPSPEEQRNQGDLFKKDSLFERSSSKNKSSSSRSGGFGSSRSRSGYGGNSSIGTSLFDTDRASTLFTQDPSLQSIVTGSAQGDFQEELEQSEEMQARFDRFSKLALMARARNVQHEGILGEVGPLFEKEFKLKAKKKEEEEQFDEVKEALLSRTWLPDGVVIESVDVGTSNRAKGTISVEITPLGLAEPVTFYLRGENGEYYTVAWDAITGGAHLYPGKQVAE